MPKALISEMKRGYADSGLSEKEINHRVYGKLNKEGAMRGSKVTKKGARMESKFVRDHGGRSTDEAAEALERRRK